MAPIKCWGVSRRSCFRQQLKYIRTTVFSLYVLYNNEIYKDNKDCRENLEENMRGKKTRISNQRCSGFKINITYQKTRSAVYYYCSLSLEYHISPVIFAPLPISRFAKIVLIKALSLMNFGQQSWLNSNSSKILCWVSSRETTTI